MNIRSARIDEAESLTGLAFAATQADGYDDATMARIKPGLQANTALIAAGLLFVAEDDAGVAGWVALRPLQFPHVFLLEDIFVGINHQRRGVGRELLDFAIRKSRQLKGRIMLVFANPFAVDFYSGSGWLALGKVPCVYSPDVELTMMAFTIAPA